MKIDLTTTVCGVSFKNPIIAASGTFGFGEEYDRFYDISRLGGISVKGLTLKPRLGNSSPRIAETSSGMLNAVGLQNPGVDAYIRDYLPKLKAKNIVVIANIAGSTVDDYGEMARKLNSSGVDMIELNISCPNVKEGGVAFGVYPESIRTVTRVSKDNCDVPLVVKLSPNVADIAENARAAQEGGADAISLINTITGMAVDPVTRRPILANVTGGLSGPAVKPVALRMVHQASRAVDIPVIGMGGIFTGRDVAEFLLCGASAVMVGTASIADPNACMRILAEFEGFLREQNIDAARELIGGLKV